MTETTTPVPKRWFRELREWTAALIISFALALLVQSYAFAQTEVKNVSMEGTLFEGQRLVENKLSYRFLAPAFGDIVIINGPEADRRLIKRVIGVPGDVIDMQDGTIVRNGVRLDEPYAEGRTYPLGLTVPYKVPRNHVFVLGDNRENSMDSRDIGPVAVSSLEGKAIFRLWPFSAFGQL